MRAAARVLKPQKIGLGIAVAGTLCAAGAVLAEGVAMVAWGWTAASCAIAAAAYARNRPGWLGKRAGRLGIAALPAAPYLAAFQTACALMRAARPRESPSEVAPGVWVGGRVGRLGPPPGVTWVVDLTAEFTARRAVRRLPGYRSFPILDGGYPHDPDAFTALVMELAAADGGVLVHCDAGRGRAPTAAAALLVARGDAPDVATAVAIVRAVRPIAAPTRSDLVFLDRIAPRLRATASRRQGDRVAARTRAAPASVAGIGTEAESC